MGGSTHPKKSQQEKTKGVVKCPNPENPILWGWGGGIIHTLDVNFTVYFLF